MSQLIQAKTVRGTLGSQAPYEHLEGMVFDSLQSALHYIIMVSANPIEAISLQTYVATDDEPIQHNVDIRTDAYYLPATIILSPVTPETVTADDVLRNNPERADALKMLEALSLAKGK